MLTSTGRTIVDVLEQDIMPRLTVDDVYGDVRFRTTNGRYWRAPCPLHGGDDANFSVDTETLTWTCWSRCGHGSAVSYLNGGESARGARFVELVHELARQVGVDVGVDTMSPDQRRRLDARLRRQDLLEAYAALAHRRLGEPGAEPIRRFLVGRGLPNDVTALVRLGLGAHPTPRGLADLRVDPRELREAGLADPRWQGRLVITWRDRAKRVATLAARHLQSASVGARYLYLEHAPVPTYFGVDALPGRSEPSPLVVVEGLMDALVLRANGIRRVLALGSCNVSQKHVDELSDLALRRVVLMLDADAAGHAGTRAFLESATRNLELHVSVVPWAAYRGCKDPAELVVTHGADAAEEALAARLPGVVFLADRILADVRPSSSSADRRDALAAVIDMLRSPGDGEHAVDVEDIVSLAVDRTGYPEGAIRAALGAATGPTATAQEGAPSATTLSLVEDMCGGRIPPEADLPDDDTIWRVVDTLKPRLATVLSLRYGRQGPPMSFVEISPHVTRPGLKPISRERVRQLKERGLKQLHYPTRLAVLVGQDAMLVLHPPKRAVRKASTLGDDGSSPGARRGPDASPPHSDIPGDLSNIVWEVLDALGGSVPLGQLTHLLRGSTGPATQALIAAHSPPHVGSMAHIEFRRAKDAVETAASTDSSLRVVRRVDDPELGPRAWIELAHRGVSSSTSDGPGRRGQRWDPAEDRILLARWQAGESVTGIASGLGRTSNGIAARLVRLGAVESRDQARRGDRGRVAKSYR